MLGVAGDSHALAYRREYFEQDARDLNVAVSISRGQTK